MDNQYEKIIGWLCEGSCEWMHFYYGRLCPRPPDPNIAEKLKISAFSIRNPRKDCINLNCYNLNILGLLCSQIV
jgi:hypothetical protein